MDYVWEKSKVGRKLFNLIDKVGGQRPSLDKIVDAILKNFNVKELTIDTKQKHQENHPL